MKGIVVVLYICVVARVSGEYVLNAAWPLSKEGLFEQVSWLAVHPETRYVYVVNRGYPFVQVFSPGGKRLFNWTTTEYGLPHSLEFRPLKLGTSAWVTDFAPPQSAGGQSYGHCVREYTVLGTPTGMAIGVCGENTAGSGLDPLQFDKVTDIAWDSTGSIYVADGDVGGLNNRVVKLAATNLVLINTLGGVEPGDGPLQFNNPHQITVDFCNRLWIADADNSRVQIADSEGALLGMLDCYEAGGAVDGIALSRPFDHAGGFVRSRLVVAYTKPDRSGGKLYVYEANMDNCGGSKITTTACEAPLQVVDVPLPANTDGPLAHSLAIDPLTTDLYLSRLLPGVPPLKYEWIH